MDNRVIISSSLYQDLAIAISECSHDKIFVLTDNITHEKCWPLVGNFIGLRHAHHITIPCSDSHKDLASLSAAWESLSKEGATRHSCLICLGGGMVTDLGGFAASTFKRGINYINIPTTLLAMVDASVGGKTGINFNGLKNEIGVFSDSQHVIINTQFLNTLDQENILSGYAEMLKHGLISSTKTWSELLQFDIINPDLSQLQSMVGSSVAVKQDIVSQDPYEKGIRKSLNFGHTIGHALESWSMHQNKPLLHGYAVAFGIICELYLSCILTGFPKDKLHTTAKFIREYYGIPRITCEDYPALLEFMTHDKKNIGGTINFTLLEDVGKIRVNQTCSPEVIKESLDFLREG